MKDFKRHLKESLPYSWYQYLLVAMAAVLLWTFLFSFYHAPTPAETVSFFVGGVAEGDRFRNDLEKRYAGAGIRRISVTSVNPNDRIFAAKFGAQGLGYCDIVLIPLTTAEATACHTAFAVPPGTFGAEPYLQEGETIGLFLPDAARAALLSCFSLVPGPYVLFVSGTSVHGAEEGQDGLAWDIVSFLVHYVSIQTADQSDR